jgi:septal ring factor EnvC (AmiA/AmiB activator)
MSDMLTPEDLKAIGQVVEEKVDELAETVQKGFSEMEERFNGVDRRFTSVEARLDKVETSLTTVERKLDRTDGKVNALVNVMEKKRIITEEEKQAVLA